MGIASLILGIISVGVFLFSIVNPFYYFLGYLIIGYAPFVGMPCGIAGIILGLWSLRRPERNKKKATTGLILSTTGLIASIVALIMFVLGY